MKSDLCKRLAMAFLLAMTFTLVYSQTTSHAKFMGIPINGTVNNFNAQLVKKGFKKSGNHFKGYFNKRKAMVGPVVENGILCGVHVAFSNLDTSGGASGINQYVRWELEDIYGVEFIERESSDPHVTELYYGITDVAFIVNLVQEVNEYEYGIDVTIYDVANASRAGVFN